jgi:hypothetical protein
MFTMHVVWLASLLSTPGFWGALFYSKMPEASVAAILAAGARSVTERGIVSAQLITEHLLRESYWFREIHQLN